MPKTLKLNSVDRQTLTFHIFFLLFLRRLDRYVLWCIEICKSWNKVKRTKKNYLLLTAKYGRLNFSSEYAAAVDSVESNRNKNKENESKAPLSSDTAHTHSLTHGEVILQARRHRNCIRETRQKKKRAVQNYVLLDLVPEEIFDLVKRRITT